VENLGVSGVLGICLVVVDQEFELGQELLVKDRVRLVRLLENIGLDQFEDISAHGLHWLNHGVVLGLVAYDGVGDLLTVEVVDLQQVLEDVLQIVQVNEASAFGDSLIYLHDVVDSLNVLMVEKLVDIHISVG